MTRVIAFANQKGGVGKTTTTLNVGAALREQGHQVLVIDLDPQGSLTTALGINPEELEETIYHSIHASIEGLEEPGIGEIIYETESEIDLVPANLELSSAEMELMHATMRELILKDILDAAELEYDYILIDCPPNLGTLTINALACASEVVIPLQADYLAVKGVNQLMRSIYLVQRKINKGLNIAGVLLTMADTRTRHTREVIDSVKETMGDTIRVFDPIIKLNVRVKDASVAGQPVLSYASDSDVAQSYRQMAQELAA